MKSRAWSVLTPTQPARRSVSKYIALFVLVACLLWLAVAFVQLLQSHRDLRKNLDDDMLWVTMQTQQEGLRLLAEISAAQVVGGTQNEGRVFNRYEIFLSRLTLLLTGPQKRYLLRMGELDELLNAVKSFENRVLWQDGRSLTLDELKQMQKTLTPIVTQLQVLNNRILQQERQGFASRRQQQFLALSQAILAVMGVLLAAAWVWSRLRYELKQARRAQQTADKARHFSEMLLEVSDEGMLVVDERFTCLLCNPAMTQLFGVEINRVVGHSVLSSLPLAQGRGAIERAIIETLKGIPSAVSDVPMPQSHGSAPQYADFLLFPMPLGQGSNGAVIFVRPTTERYQQQQLLLQQLEESNALASQRSTELEALQRQLILLFEVAAVGLAVFDQQGELIVSNKAMQGYLSQLGLASSQPTHIEPYIRQLNQRLLHLDTNSLTTPTLSEGVSASVEVELNSGVWLSIRYDVVADGSSQIRILDSTLTQHFEPIREAAETLSIELARFYEEYRHHWPDAAPLLQHWPNTGLSQPNLAYNESPAALLHRLRGLALALPQLRRLSWSYRLWRFHTQQGAFFTPHAYILLDVAEQAIRDTQQLFKQRSIELTVINRYLVGVGNAEAIRFALGALLINACRYSDHSTSVQLVLREAAKDRLEIEVIDLGDGLTLEASQAFAAFERGPADEQELGAGLGLYLTQAIAQAHQGRLSYRRTTEGATVFSLCLQRVPNAHSLNSIAST